MLQLANAEAEVRALQQGQTAASTATDRESVSTHNAQALQELEGRLQSSQHQHAKEVAELQSTNDALQTEVNALRTQLADMQQGPQHKAQGALSLCLSCMCERTTMVGLRQL